MDTVIRALPAGTEFFQRKPGLQMKGKLSSV